MEKNYIRNYYLRKEFTTFHATLETFNISKALQSRYIEKKEGVNLSYRYYLKESTKLILTFELGKINFAELVERLIALRSETLLKYPDFFRQDGKGWYDLVKMKEKDAKEAWRALPVDKMLMAKAKKEGRVNVVSRR